jgi:hypothetical protein
MDRWHERIDFFGQRAAQRRVVFDTGLNARAIRGRAHGYNDAIGKAGTAGSGQIHSRKRDSHAVEIEGHEVIPFATDSAWPDAIRRQLHFDGLRKCSQLDALSRVVQENRNRTLGTRKHHLDLLFGSFP